MIYDCFIFYNENDLLDLRLNYLNSVIDKFIIVEANRTFTGIKKSKNFDAERFKNFSDKIIYVYLEDIPVQKTPWHYESLQRNYILDILKKQNVSEEDIILLSDVDEIPSIDAIEYYKNNLNGIYGFAQKMYNYYFNLLDKYREPWHRAKILQYKDFFDTSLEDTILYGNNLPKECNTTNTVSKIRLMVKFPVIYDAGWHFSYLGNARFIKEKLNSFSHQEFNKPPYNDIEHIESCIKSCKDIFGNNTVYQRVKINNSFPDYLVKNVDKFKQYIL